MNEHENTSKASPSVSSPGRGYPHLHGSSPPAAGDPGASARAGEHGHTMIADAVVSKIAGIAAREVSGVYDLGGGTARAVGQLRGRLRSGRTNPSQGVAVEVGDEQAAIDVDVVVEYGAAIADLTAQIRQKVISAVERMTGLEVTEVNVTVHDVHRAGEDADDDPEQGRTGGPTRSS